MYLQHINIDIYIFIYVFNLFFIYIHITQQLSVRDKLGRVLQLQVSSGNQTSQQTNNIQAKRELSASHRGYSHVFP